MRWLPLAGTGWHAAKPPLVSQHTSGLACAYCRRTHARSIESFTWPDLAAPSYFTGPGAAHVRLIITSTHLASLVLMLVKQRWKATRYNLTDLLRFKSYEVRVSHLASVRGPAETDAAARMM